MMKKLSKKMASILLVLLCLTLAVPRMDGNALTQKQKALRAYASWLSKSKVNVIIKGSVQYYNYGRDPYQGTRSSKVKFALAYIDNDNIPELIVYTDEMGFCGSFGILTYRNGRIVRCYASDGCDSFKGYYKKTGYFKAESNMEIHYATSYFKLGYNKGRHDPKTAPFALIYYITHPHFKFESRCMNGRPVSASSFRTALKRATKNQKISTVKYYNNTKANRSRVLGY